MEKRTYAAGEVVYAEGQTSQAVYLIKSGKIELIDTYPETGQVVAKAIGAGKVFGEVELIDRKVRSSTAKAAETTKVIILAMKKF